MNLLKTNPPSALWIPALVASLFVGCSSSTTTEIKPGHLVVSQVMYRNLADSLEWLEIRNDGEGAAVVAGVKIDAVGYQFPASSSTLAPGARIVLTNDEALFAKHHPGVRIFAVYTGRLANEGEEIQLDGAEGKDFKFTYSNREPWPAGPDVVGTSLVYVGGEPSLPGSWKSSLKAGGSPGAAVQTVDDKDIWISEVRPADANGNGFVELASASSEPVDISGWIVAKSATSSKADTIAPSTSIPAHGRLVLRQQPASGQLGWGSLFPAATSDELVLIARGADGAMTGNVHTIAWSAIPDGMSIGKIGDVGVDAGTDLIAAPSPGAADASRRLGLATITEICYQPDSGDAEFVELQNETDSVIHLGYPADTSGSWSLAGAGLTFHSGDTIPAHGRLVAVSKADMAADAFRSKWNIPSEVPVVTFSGKLDNSGETIELRHPSIPVAGGSGAISWKPVVEDAAAWLPVAPWPAAAAGAGSCLQRSSKSLPGTSPSAWTASQPTPGR